MTGFTPITIIPIEQFRDQEPTTFREVVAYLHGVADAFAARVPIPRPVSLAPLSLAPLSPAALQPSSRAPAPTRITLRFGELPFERASVWPHVVVGGDWEATRGGSRTIDLTEPESSRSSWPIVRRVTLPYEAPSISLAPRASIAPAWADERSSEIRLRASRLPVEWYELTGTDGGTFDPTVREAANA
ncbi:MAG TPA: hypothetical protein VGM06_06990 [Polyangiaceae bacterium]|jgi:hypothetical protein